jgi:hypothetical protein
MKRSEDSQLPAWKLTQPSNTKLEYYQLHRDARHHDKFISLRIIFVQLIWVKL